jgi:hypothetical protein
MPAHTLPLVVPAFESRLAFRHQTLNIRSNLSREHGPCHVRKTSPSVGYSKEQPHQLWLTPDERTNPSVEELTQVSGRG